MQASLNPNKVVAEAFFARHLGGACEPVGRDFDGSHAFRAGGEILLAIATSKLELQS